jgi:hypothetical protein
MTTQRQVAANRLNSQKSTGPQSVVGKSRAAQNARRHGLSVPFWIDPKLAAEIEGLALEIAGDDAPATIQVLARAIAKAQIDLNRVRQARHRLLEKALVRPTGKNVSELAGSLNGLDRYESRAFSHRKNAIDAFDAARVVLRNSEGTV